MFGYNKYKQDLGIPGTELLVDNQHKANAIETKNDVVYIPQPSADPNDPLNWSKAAKLTNFAICAVYVLVNSAGSMWTTTWYDTLAYDLDASYNMLNTGSGLQMLFLAFGSWMSQITADTIGRRPTYIISSFFVMLGSIVFASLGTYTGYLVFNVLNGIGIAAMDTIVEVTIGDMFFVHQHGSYMAIYTLCLSVGSSFGVIIAGYLPEWHWCNYLVIILSGTTMFCQIFFLEESYYNREAPPSVISVTGTTGSDSAVLKTDIASEQHECTSDDGTFYPPRKLLLQRMRLMKPAIKGNANIFTLAVSSFVTLRYPAVLWGAIAYGIQICWLQYMGVTQAEFFAAAPYYFSTGAIGNLSYAGVIGGVIGTIYVAFSDTYITWKARRNGGILEPEFRLDLCWIPIIINTLGLCLYGYGPAYSMSWVVGALGIGMINFGLLALVSVILIYAMECYPRQVTKTIVAILFVRNSIGTVFTWIFQYWLDGMGLIKLTAFLAVLCFFINGFALAFTLWGKNMRHWTAHWYSTSLHD